MSDSLPRTAMHAGWFNCVQSLMLHLDTAKPRRNFRRLAYTVCHTPDYRIVAGCLRWLQMEILYTNEHSRKPLSIPWIILCAKLGWTIADGAVQPKLSSACSMHASTRRWEIWRSSGHSWWWLGTPNQGKRQQGRLAPLIQTIDWQQGCHVTEKKKEGKRDGMPYPPATPSLCLQLQLVF